MDFDSVVRRRRSIRSYRRALPPPGTVERIVDVARRAPTAGFSQGIDFLVLDDPSAVSEFFAITTHPDHVVPDHLVGAEPPIVVIVWSDPQRYLARYAAPDKARFGLQDPDRWAVKFWDVDAAMAAMQLQLAAVNEGLDTWFFGIAHGEAEMRERFRVPDDRSMIGVVGLGYRSEDEVGFGSGTKRPRRPLDEQLHRNGW
jgi:nitroreductase